MAYTAQDVIKLYDSAGKEPYNDEVCESIAVVANLNDIDLMTAAEIITRKRVEDEPDWPEEEKPAEKKEKNVVNTTKSENVQTSFDRDDSSECPICGSYRITGGSFESDGSGVWQEVTCDECGA